jgi:hypothetical protein
MSSLFFVVSVMLSPYRQPDDSRAPQGYQNGYRLPVEFFCGHIAPKMIQPAAVIIPNKNAIINPVFSVSHPSALRMGSLKM